MAAQFARNRAVLLQQELVVILRATGSVTGAEQYWQLVDFKKGFGRKLACYGFADRRRQLQMNKVSFPDVNFSEVDAALAAGNKLYQLYQLASGSACLARDPEDGFRRGNRGLKVIRTLKH